VKQYQVEVRAGAELAAGQTADACERRARLRPAHLGVELDQGVLDPGGERTPTIRPCRGNPRGPDRDVETLAG